METELIPGLPDDVALRCLLRLPFYFITVARGVCRRWKHELASSSFCRLRKAAGFARPVVALLLRSRRSSHLALIDPATGAWVTRRLIADRPHGLRGCRHAVVVGRDLVLVGGWDESASRPTGEVNICDLVTGDWCQGAPMPPPLRFSYTCAAGPRTVFVSGGRDATTNENLSSALAYDTVTDAWVEFDMVSRWPWWDFLKEPGDAHIQRSAHVAAHEERRMYPCPELYEGEKELKWLTWYDGESLWLSLGLSPDEFSRCFQSFFIFQF